VRDHSAVERYWQENYIQHNPSMANGHQGLRELLEHIEPGFRCEPGIFLDSDDLVIARSQEGTCAAYCVYILRLENYRTAEHGDVVQSEAHPSKTVSDNPMTSFNYVVPAGYEAQTGRPREFRSELYFEADGTFVFKIVEGGDPG
jgi:predicted SnoaL-like aldol condensation-catalyzing enzyme